MALTPFPSVCPADTPPPPPNQVPHTDILERFLDAEDLTMGRCKDLAMDPHAFDSSSDAHKQH